MLVRLRQEVQALPRRVTAVTALHPRASCPSVSLRGRHEGGTVSAPLRDDSLDTVTPGGHPAPLGARGDAEAGERGRRDVAEPGAARPLDAAPARRSRHVAARVRGGRRGRRQRRTDERAGRRRRHLGRALDAVLGRVARTAVHVARRRRRLHRRRHRCDDLVAHSDAHAWRPHSSWSSRSASRSSFSRRKRDMRGRDPIWEAPSGSLVLLVPERSRRDRDRRVRPARPARGDTRAHASERVAAISPGLLLGALIGASRVVLGVHYVTDVLAGAFLGLAWLSACLLVARFLGGRRAIRGS